MRKLRVQVLKAIFILVAMYIFFVYVSFKSNDEIYSANLNSFEKQEIKEHEDIAKEINQENIEQPEIIKEINKENSNRKNANQKMIAVVIKEKINVN